MAPMKSEPKSIGSNRYKPYDSYPRLKPSMPSPTPSSPQGRNKEQVEKSPSPSPPPFSEHLTDFFNGVETNNDWDDRNATTALKYYNTLHHTDYKVVRDDGFKCNNHIFNLDRKKNLYITHWMFAAKSERVVDGDSPAKLFFAEFHRRKLEKEVVIYCRILDGLTTGCSDCDELYHSILDRHLKSFGPCDSYFDLESFMISPSPSSIQGKIEPVPPSPYSEHLIDFSDGANSDSDSYSESDSDCENDFYDCNDDNAKLAVKYYNSLHGTDYKVVRHNGFKCDIHRYHPIGQRHLGLIHSTFAAKSKGALNSDSPAELFFAELYERNIEKEVVISCRILDGPTTGCRGCDISYPYIRDRLLQSPGQLKAKAEERRKNGTFPNIALAYYNENHHEDYEFVGGTEMYTVLETKFAMHCNFKAKKKRGGGGSLPKLFFAELDRTKDVWEVSICHIIDGCRTIAGCYMCEGRRGKKIQHPTCEFRYGFYDQETGRTFIDDSSKP